MKHIIPTICPDSGSAAPVVAAPLWDALFRRDAWDVWDVWDVWDAWSRDDSSPANHPGPRCPTVTGSRKFEGNIYRKFIGRSIGRSSEIYRKTYRKIYWKIISGSHTASSKHNKNDGQIQHF